VVVPAPVVLDCAGPGCPGCQEPVHVVLKIRIPGRKEPVLRVICQGAPADAPPGVHLVRAGAVGKLVIGIFLDQCPVPGDGLKTAGLVIGVIISGGGPAHGLGAGLYPAVRVPGRDIPGINILAGHIRVFAAGLAIAVKCPRQVEGRVRHIEWQAGFVDAGVVEAGYGEPAGTG